MKNRQLKAIIDQMRTIIWEINTMIVMRKTWYALFFLHHSCIQEINIQVAAGQYKQASRCYVEISSQSELVNTWNQTIPVL